jgi:hypothetical protein
MNQSSISNPSICVAMSSNAGRSGGASLQHLVMSCAITTGQSAGTVGLCNARHFIHTRDTQSSYLKPLLPTANTT